ncbi:MAG: DUF86 domain-containing protein [Aquificae bacterium]|nr:DUF86 domain-containing protein [Aquificota bacterium]
MLDTQLLNEKASKLILFLKKIKKILQSGKEVFLSTPMYPDRTQYYLISAYNELEEIACHLLKEITKEKTKGNCVDRIIQEGVFSEKINRVLLDFKEYIESITKGQTVPPEQLYTLSTEIVNTLPTIFIKELATVVKELKEKQPQLKIPVNLKKLNDHGKAVKSAVRKASNFVNTTEEDFENNPLFIDRARYFAVVMADSTLWICRHILRKMGKKVSKDCFKQLIEEGIIKPETGEKVSKIVSIREKLADPTQEIPPKELYHTLKETLPYFLQFLTEVSSYLVKK